MGYALRDKKCDFPDEWHILAKSRHMLSLLFEPTKTIMLSSILATSEGHVIIF